MTGRTEQDFTDIAVGFARTLRHAGVAAGPDRVQAMLAAVAELDVLDAGQVYWAGRLTLCSDPEDLPRYDAAFALYFSARTAGNRPTGTPPPVLRAAPFEVDADGAGAERDADTPTFAVQASRHEVLRHKDVNTLDPAERDELQRLFALLAPRVASRRTLRYRPANRGRVDLDATVRQMLHRGGEVGRLSHRRHRMKPRRLVLLIDVSGSMAPYSDSAIPTWRWPRPAGRCRTGAAAPGWAMRSRRSSTCGASAGRPAARWWWSARTAGSAVTRASSGGSSRGWPGSRTGSSG
jgi:hypothetical protein